MAQGAEVGGTILILLWNPRDEFARDYIKSRKTLKIRKMANSDESSRHTFRVVEKKHIYDGEIYNTYTQRDKSSTIALFYTYI